jgi:hypothetical protein
VTVGVSSVGESVAAQAEGSIVTGTGATCSPPFNPSRPGRRNRKIPLLVLCAMVGFATVVGLFVVLLLRPTFIGKKKVNFQANCSALGCAPLRGLSAEWIACGGEVRGRRFLLTPVERPSILPRRIDILSEAGWLHCAGCDHHRLVTFAC